MSIGKWIIAGLGWAKFGPVGGIIGYFLGKAIFDRDDNSDSEKSYSRIGYGHSGPYHNTGTSNDLAVVLMVLIAAVMKADGAVKQSELNYVKRFLLKNYGEEKGKELLGALRDMVEKDIPLQDVCLQIKHNTDYNTRYHLLDFLIGLAVADLTFSPSEERVLSYIRNYLGVNLGDYLSMKARHTSQYSSQSGYSTGSGSAKDPYKVLGLERNASDDDVKKAYRRFAMKYHPDKVEHLGEEMKKNAEKQFREINEAYETIKTERGIK